jgi:hypothetical protein
VRGVVAVRATPEQQQQEEEEPVPVWVQREQEAKRKAESGESDPLPYGVYLLGSSIIMIAVVRLASSAASLPTPPESWGWRV